MAVLLAVMFGIIDFGRALYTYSFVANAARKARAGRSCADRSARCSITVPRQSTDLQPYVQSLSEGAMTASNIAASLSFPSCPGLVTAHGNSAGCVAEVTVTYPFTFISPFVSACNQHVEHVGDGHLELTPPLRVILSEAPY